MSENTVPAIGTPEAALASPALASPTSDPNTGPATMPKRLWILYPLGLLSLSIVWGSVLQVLLARQVAAFGSGGPDDAGTLGVVVSFAAIVGLVAGPVLGFASDRTRVRFLGRRNIWILGTALVGAVALIITGLSPNALVLGIVWAIAIWPLTGYQTAMAAVLPERIPVRVRGTMSGLSGTLGLLGTFIGVAVGGLVTDPLIAYGVVAAQLVIIGAVFAFFTKDLSAEALRALDASAPKVRSKLPSLRTERDFWLTFVGRFLTFFGYFIVQGMMLFLLRDYIKFGDGSTDAASAAIVQVSGISILFTMVAAILGGVLADRVGRLKIFVVVSSLMFVPAALIPLLMPDFTGILIGMSVAGLAFGAYLAVDQALISRVLPNLDDAGRDIGMISVANGAPQIITPVLGGLLISTVGYPSLFVVMMAFTIIGAIAVMFIKRVR
ncbi:MFS transporter [Microbacterium terricola]|uniref:MFS transporter n=1 Tax=Microbacterium terricola TaxID=344163 RepID=A0ABM8E3A2_9MICO|nr:MFS transporter [Microbacterium terricola]UYK40032.1 MFS transporter [Microbacterium terricola]BDV32275.1 MFS transporter [Microbacterium terricola]